MAAEVTVGQDAQGRLVVRKASLPGDRGDPRLEAAWLRRASGCGVVELVATLDDPPAMVTLHAGSHTWRTLSPDPPTAAALLASALRAVGALHRRGLVHGALTADHLIVSGGRVVLCSPRPGAGDPTADRSALAALAAETSQRWLSSSPPQAPPPGWGRAVERLARPESGWTLDDVADQLDGGGRRSGTTGTPAASPMPRWRRIRSTPTLPPARVVVAVVVGAASVGGVLVAATGPGAVPAPGPAGPGSRVDVAGARYRSTGPAGVLAATDRPCAGSPAAALLEPGSGVVWGFVQLPDGTAPVPGVAVAQVPGASRVVVVESDGCHRLVAQGPAGEADLSAG